MNLFWNILGLSPLWGFLIASYVMFEPVRTKVNAFILSFLPFL